MEQLFSIRQREITYRTIIIGLIVLMVSVILGCIYYTTSIVQESKRNIYVLKNDKALLRAVSTDFNNSYDILAKNQIEEINNLLFQQIPDPNNINQRIKRAETLGDRSILTELDKLKTNNYYDNIVNQSYYTLLITDSIHLDYRITPHYFQYYGKLKIVRNSQTHWREIKTTGEIEPTGQITENDERGFLIKKYKIH